MATAMPTSMSRERLRPLEACAAGAPDGWATGAPATGEDPALGTASTMRAAAASAAAASTVPAPDPSSWPPACLKRALSVSALVTCAGLSAGNCARMRAAMPVTTALAAAVLFSWAYAVGPLAAMTPAPAAVSVTYGRWLLNEALLNCESKAPTEMTPL
jgi:hypothetical protein